MPLVRISVPASATAETVRGLADAVHLAMVETIDVPPTDRFQIITRHETDHLIVDLKRGAVPIARSALGNRISFAASFVEGKGITETEPHSVAAAEIKLLADEIWRKVSSSGRKAAA